LSGAAARLEAGAAVHRAIRPRREWDLTGLTAGAADDVVHVERALRSTFGLRAMTAVTAALRLVQETLLLIELLLARGPDECVPAFAAAQ